MAKISKEDRYSDIFRRERLEILRNTFAIFDHFAPFTHLFFHSETELSGGTCLVKDNNNKKKKSDSCSKPSLLYSILKRKIARAEYNMIKNMWGTGLNDKNKNVMSSPLLIQSKNTLYSLKKIQGYFTNGGSVKQMNPCGQRPEGKTLTQNLGRTRKNSDFQLPQEPLRYERCILTCQARSMQVCNQYNS